MDSTVTLRGITWGHTRGFVPMVATAQRYSELHPGVRIQWELRSLQAFADQSIEALSRSYDLLVIDHPSIGEAAAHGLFLPLDAHVPASFLEDQARHSVGQSHPSYTHSGHAWALATHAATPVSAAPDACPSACGAPQMASASAARHRSSPAGSQSSAALQCCSMPVDPGCVLSRGPAPATQMHPHRTSKLSSCLKSL